MKMTRAQLGPDDKNIFLVGQRVRLVIVTEGEDEKFVGAIGTVVRIQPGEYYYRVNFDGYHNYDSYAKDYSDANRPFGESPSDFCYHYKQIATIGGEPDENGNLY